MKDFIVCCVPEEKSSYFVKSREEFKDKYYLTSLDADIPFGEPFIFQGKAYCQCWKDNTKRVLVVREFKKDPPINLDDKRLVTCPACGYEDPESVAWADDGEHECTICQSIYEFCRQVKSTYSTELVKEHMIRSLEELQMEAKNEN